MPVDANPFAALTLVGAPAILTNASALLILSTSNRFARTIDRARAVAGDIEKANPQTPPGRIAVKATQLERLERRSVMQLSAMRLFYLALGSFASATLVSLIGAVTVMHDMGLLVRVLEVVAAVVGFVGVGALVVGSGYLVRDTQLAVLNVSQETAYVRANLTAGKHP
jgi:hypothetical protein